MAASAGACCSHCVWVTCCRGRLAAAVWCTRRSLPLPPILNQPPSPQAHIRHLGRMSLSGTVRPLRNGCGLSPLAERGCAGRCSRSGGGTGHTKRTHARLGRCGRLGRCWPSWCWQVCCVAGFALLVRQCQWQFQWQWQWQWHLGRRKGRGRGMRSTEYSDNAHANKAAKSAARTTPIRSAAYVSND